MGLATGFGEDALDAAFWVDVGEFAAGSGDELAGSVFLQVGQGVGHGADQG
jgi:hypothetical protein